MKKKNSKACTVQFSKFGNKKKKENGNTIDYFTKFQESKILNVNTSNSCLDNKKTLNNSDNNLVNKRSYSSNIHTESHNFFGARNFDCKNMSSTDYFNNYHCIYCNISFPNKIKLQAHCLTDEHQSVIISDEGRDWKFRPPPRGVLANEYFLCQNFTDKHICRFGDQCVQAHSREELSEWKERFEYRSMKLEKAKERELHGASYADRLLEKLNSSQNIDMLLSEKVDGVTFSISSDLNLCISQKPSSHTWTITFHCPYRINAVALLHDSHRNHFSLTNITMINSQKHIHKSFKLKDTQEWVNNDPEHIDNVNMEYKIEVQFETEIYGTFRQAIVVDFGVEPVFIQKFCVDIVPLDEFKELESARTTVITQTERWCHENTDIVLFEPLEKSSNDVFNDKLLEMYPPPTNKNITLNQMSLEKHPTKNNYRNRMHDLLNYEEMAQFDLISHFNIKSYLHLSKSYLIMPYSVSVAKYALAGELYAKLDLSSEVSEDSPHGRLILNNCNSVLVTKMDESNPRNKNKERRAYEALLEAKTKKEIYIRLSKHTVSELGLMPDSEAPLDIQFQLNRLPFCEMHYAIDHLSTFDFLFPNVINELTIPWSPSIQWNEFSDMKLNLQQKEALVAITTNIGIKLPPILIIGPFGTGKTFTMSQAILQIIQQPESRILVCTHSNSAADIYIRDYLHPQFEAGLLKSKPLRIYYHRRRVATVHNTIHKYCLFENKNGEQMFCLPTKSEVINHRIIVTTINTSIGLAQLGIPKGFFTHILIDEAAQVMECSTLIPLSLANASTRIVLAGDYMQLSTEVFSSVCKERNLQISLLERLYDLYSSDYPCRIMLVENYRSHPAIIKFTSKFFYEGKLKPRGKISAHPRYHPLTFFTARGEDVQDANSTAYFNNSEVLEVCERVMEVVKTWPVKLWGPLNEESIGVLSPYLDQVMRIRAELRKKKLYRVSVERVLNVQGKEFRVVILSTVRTRHTCSGNDSSLDFGFLSNAKLLTTAITRAQSLVAVVGDPVSLCSLGQCRKLWEEFLRQCSEAGSLHGITWTNLRSQLDGIELRKIYGLNPLAQEFIPRYLLLSAVPQVTLLPPTPPIQYIPYGRPFHYSPSIFPALPVSYPASTGFLGPTVPIGAPLAPAKTTDAQKLNVVGPYTGIPFPSYSNVYSNRATIIPFGAAPAAPAIGPIPTISASNFFPTSNASQAINPTFIQPPSIGVPIYMTGTLPYHQKLGTIPQVMPARPPPGFNNTNQINNLLDQERLKGTLQLQHSIVNNSHSVSKPSQEARCSSPDKNIQFLNNVHFPREPQTSSWNDNLRTSQEPRTLNLEIGRTCLENSHSSNSDSFMGEEFADEISKLLNEQSPIKSYPVASAAENSQSCKNYLSFDNSENRFQNHISVNCDHLKSSISSSLFRETLSSKSFLTVEQVESSLYSSSDDHKSRQTLDSKNFGKANTLTSSLQERTIFSQRLPDLSQENHLLSDSLKWGNISSNSGMTQHFPFTNFLRTSETGSSSIPLYLRKGSSNNNLSSNSQSKSEAFGGTYGSSSGWDIDTVKSANNISRSIESTMKQDFNQDANLTSTLRRLDGRERENALLHKSDQNESKTYAGVLRSKKFDLDGEQI